MRQSHCRRSLTSSLVSSCYVDWYKTANLSHQPIRGSPSRQRFCPSSPKIATPMTNVDTIHGRRSSTPNHPATQTPEGDSSRRDAEARRARLPSLSASATQREFLPPIPTSRASHKLDQPDPGAGARPTPVLIPPSPAPKVRTMPAYGTAIGIGHRHEWRAESPVSSGGSGRGLGVSGLQPSGSIITSSTQAAGLGFLIVRLWRAGKGAAPHHGKPVHARPPRPLPPSAPAADNPFPLPIFPSPFAFIGLYSRFSPSRPRANGPA